MLGNETGSLSKIQVMNERWQEIQVSMDREKNSRLQIIEEQVAALDDRISHGKSFSQQKLQVLAQKTTKARDTVQQLQIRREEIDQAIDLRLKKAEEALAAELVKQLAGREQYREGWSKKCDEKLMDICHSMESLTTEKGETVQSTTVRIKNRLAGLQENIKAEQKRREEETNRVTEAFEQEINKLYSQLESQKKNREQTGRRIESMLKEIQVKLQGEVEEERRLRKQTNASLLTLLEQTCIKVEKAFQ